MRRGRLGPQQLALGQEAALRRAAPAHADEVRPPRLRRRARVGPVRRGAHVRGLIARARPSPRYRYRTAYGQKEKGAAGRSVCTCDSATGAAALCLCALRTAAGPVASARGRPAAGPVVLAIVSRLFTITIVRSSASCILFQCNDRM